MTIKMKNDSNSILSMLYRKMVYNKKFSNNVVFFMNRNTRVKKKFRTHKLYRESSVEVPMDKRTTQLTLKPLSFEYSLDTFHRSNQDTCLLHKPAVFEGDWIQSGDLLADCAASVGGELSLGHNILVAYMPWEGYNYEDAILLSERLVFDDVYTSIHIERYEISIRDTKTGEEEITREIPDLCEAEFSKLDKNGLVRLGTWVEEGDILVGKITPISKKSLSNYQNLLNKILKKEFKAIKDSSLRAPKGLNAKVIKIKILKYKKSQVGNLKKPKPGKFIQRSPVINVGAPVLRNSYNPNQSPQNKGLKPKNLGLKPFSYTKHGPGGSYANSPSAKGKSLNFNRNRLKQLFLSNKCKPLKRLIKRHLKGISNPNSNLSIGEICTLGHTQTFQANQLISQYQKTKLSAYGTYNSYAVKVLNNLYTRLRFKSNSVRNDQNVLLNYFTKSTKFPIFQKVSLLKKRPFFLRKIVKTKKITKKIPIEVHIYLAEKRKIQVGDKIAGRHGNKGIISQIFPREDMPFLPDGTPLDIVLNPLGVPSRMNVGQIYECLLGLAGKYLGEQYKIFPFDEIYGAEASRSFVYSKLYEAREKTGLKWLFNPSYPGKMRIYDGRTGDTFNQPVTVGRAYVLKLVHMVDDKIHARSTGPYSLVTQQPLRGRAKTGGQRLGEMEVWAIEGYGAAFTLLEMLTIKSDDMRGRISLWSSIIYNKEIAIGTPEAFNVLIRELQALCLDIGLF